MKIRLFVLLLAGLMAVSCGKHRAGVSVERTHPSNLEYPKLKVETPEYTQVKLDNGIEGFFIEDHEVPVVNITMLVKTYYPDKNRLGRNEMANWVMRNGGTEKWPSDKLNDELEFLAARINFNGGGLSTRISLNCLKKDLPRVLGIYADLIMNPVFPEEKIEMKRKTMLEELRRKNDKPMNIARREYRKLVYKGHPYGWSRTEEACNSIAREDLVKFHEKYFHPGNTIIGISGDVTESEITDLLVENFSGWERKDVEIEDFPRVQIDEKENYNYVYKGDMNQAYIMIGHLGIRNDNPDRCAINIMNYILGGGSFASWITEEVRVKRGLAYSAGSSFRPGNFAKGTFTAYSQTKAGEYSRTINLIYDQIERMRTEGPTQQEFDKAVDSFLNSHVFDYESKEAIVRRLVELQFQGRPLDTPEKDMEKYASLTIDEVIRAAGKYLRPEDFTVLVVGDKEKFDKPLSTFGEVNEIEIE
ncbi:MAG TPA: pitrilysin family protein [Candidatus Krumholzibacteriaceae bacterium]|nr:pitrilysin family protein [Candidatus Krumholzibacteriaceae bacterium]